MTTTCCGWSVVLRRASSPGTGAAGLTLLQEQAQLPFEVRDLLEVLVDAGEPEVRHVVELPEGAERLQAHLLAGHERAAPAQLLLHARGELLHLLLGHRPVLDR